MPPETGNEPPRMLRAIGRWSLSALVVNCIIGSGIFGLPALVTGYLGRFAPLGYVVAALGMGTIMACFAEVASRFTGSGGPYLYARAAFGSFAGIENGWLTWLARLTATAANANLFVVYLGEFWPRAASGLLRATVLTVLVGLLVAVNVRGVRQGTWLSNLFTVTKLVPLVLLIAAGGFFLFHGHAAGGVPESALRPRDVMEAMLLLVFAYGGFESAMIPLGEARDPRRDAPFALAVALATCAVTYTAVQLVVMNALPDPTHTERPLAAAARVMFGSPGAAIIVAGALCSTYGLLSANMLNVPRLTFALAEQREFPAFFAIVHRRFRTPYVSIAIFGTLLWALAVAGSFRWNAGLSAVARLATYASVCAALPVLRRKSAEPPRFRLPLGDAFAVVGFAFSLSIASRMGPGELVILLVITAVAVLNWRWARSRVPRSMLVRGLGL
jgi:APA family basic amino acid/polyamine antiporter